MSLYHNTQKQSNAGFTLVELMVTIALIGLIMTMAGSFFNFSTTFEKKTEMESDFQGSMRQASRVLNNSIRDASVTFTLSEDVFSKPKQENWNYLGIENGNEIVQYIWNKDKNGVDIGGHDRVVLVPSKSAISYNLYFVQNKPGSKLIEFTLEGIDNNSANKKLVINSEIAAMNSLAVDDGGSMDNPAVAVAYRSDPTPKPEQIATRVPVNMLVALVLDDSGSMSRSLGAGTRLSVMKAEVNNLINDLKVIENAKVSIVSFANDANNPAAFITGADFQASTLNNLRAEGGTNTGDGLRRAYHQIDQYKRAHSTEKFVSYVILLTDGNPTYRTSSTQVVWEQQWINPWYYEWVKTNYNARTDNGNTSESYRFGDGGESSTNIGASMGYVRTICTTLLAPSPDTMTFAIGFSSVEGGFENIQEIARIANNDTAQVYYYEADGSAQLQAAFEEITTTMVNNMWHIYGPYPVD